MRNLLNFLLKYNHWFLFVLLEVISLTLLFRFNNYQGSAFFTSANYLAGIVYEASSQVTRYFGLTEVNKDLTARNVELEIEVERLSQALEQYTQDTTGVANLRKEACLVCLHNGIILFLINQAVSQAPLCILGIGIG